MIDANFTSEFLILFFMLAVAAMHIEKLAHIGLLGADYIDMRITGRVLGTRLGDGYAAPNPTLAIGWGWHCYPRPQ